MKKIEINKNMGIKIIFKGDETNINKIKLI